MVFNLLSLFAMNKKHLLLFVFSYISFVCNTHAESYAHDTLVNVLRNEVQFYFDKLKNKETPAYFISLRVVDNKRLFLSSDFGLSSMDENHTRILTPQVRVGSPDLDNFAYLPKTGPVARLHTNVRQQAYLWTAMPYRSSKKWFGTGYWNVTKQP